MNTDLTLTQPVVIPGYGLRFSAYALKLGYFSVVLSIDAACSRLGAANSDPQQLLLAFKLNQPRIVRVLSAKGSPSDGRIVVLGARDFT